MNGDGRLWAVIAREITNPRERNWKRLVRAAPWLAKHNEDEFCVRDVLLGVYGKAPTGMARSLGRLIRSLPGVPEARKKGVRINGKPTTIPVYRTRVVRSVLQDHAILIRDNSGTLCLNPLITGNFKDDISSVDLSSIKINERRISSSRFSYSSFLPPYSEATLDMLDQRWLATHGLPFRPSYLVAKSILDNSIPDEEPFRSSFPCLRFTLGMKDKGYTNVTQIYLDQALPKAGLAIDILPTRTAHRLIKMVESPDELKMWKYGGDDKHIHHECFQTDCVCPSHLVITDKRIHTEIHKSLGQYNHGSLCA